MRHRSNQLFLLATLAAMLTFACQKDISPDSKSNLLENGGGFVHDRGGKDGDGKGTMTIVGRQQSNPYAVDNIRKAYKSLYEINLTALTANHLYVRFLPQDVQDIGELLNTGLAFTDVYAPNPSLVNGRFDFTPDHGGGVVQSADSGQPCGCPLPDNVRKPSGCVTVFDNMLPQPNQWDPVREVKVLVSRTQFFGWAFHRTAVTSGKGCWEINHNYRKKINIWVKYESPTCNVKVMQGNADLQTLHCYST